MSNIVDRRIGAYLRAFKRRFKNVLGESRVRRLFQRLRFHSDGTPHGRREMNGYRVVKWPANGSRP